MSVLPFDCEKMYHFTEPIGQYFSENMPINHTYVLNFIWRVKALQPWGKANNNIKRGRFTFYLLRLDFTERQLEMMTYEMKDKICAIVEDVEYKVIFI